MDHKFIEQTKQWLETTEAERDYTIGAYSNLAVVKSLPPMLGSARTARLWNAPQLPTAS